MQIISYPFEILNRFSFKQILPLDIIEQDLFDMKIKSLKLEVCLYVGFMCCMKITMTTGIESSMNVILKRYEKC